MENVITLGKLLSLRFCFLLHSILFLISQTSDRTYKIISSNVLTRPIMGTVFLVRTQSLCPSGAKWCSSFLQNLTLVKHKDSGFIIITLVGTSISVRMHSITT